MDLHRYIASQDWDKLVQEHAEMVRVLTTLVKAVNSIETTAMSPRYTPISAAQFNALYDAADHAGALLAKVVRGMKS